jgi:integrase/recombinase XerD
MAEISPLRRRMIEDMTVRNLSPATQQSYLNAVSKFSRYFGRSPDRLGLEDVHAFQVHLVATGISWPALNQIVCALRFFYGVTLGQNTVPERIAYAREPSKLPVVLSADEVVRFLEAIPSLKSRTALTTVYAAGLRVSEVVLLKIADIDSQRMVIRVEQGKGGKDRYVMLSPQLLRILRTYWRLARPKRWLFPGRDDERPLVPNVLHAACRSACAAAGLSKPVTVHTLRHTFATVYQGRRDLAAPQAPDRHNVLEDGAGPNSAGAGSGRDEVRVHQPFEQHLQLAGELLRLPAGQIHPALELNRHEARGLAHRVARGGQGEPHLAFVRGIAPALDEAARFQTLQQRRQGAGIEMEPLA